MLSTSNIPNAPGWIDVGSRDLDATIAFYGAVFGWTAEEAPPPPEADPSMRYVLFNLDGKAVAGLGPMSNATDKPGWTTYIRVADAAATVKSAEMAGATVRAPYMEIGSEGGLAMLTDPSGAEFALWQPGTFDGAQIVQRPGSLLWIELTTHDVEAAKKFYGDLFGWKTQAFPMPEGAYDMWTLDPDDDQAAFGGVMQIAEGFPVQDVVWLPYFCVEDCEATVAAAEGAGGSVLMPATEAPPGVLATLADPQGARFNLIKPAPME